MQNIVGKRSRLEILPCLRGLTESSLIIIVSKETSVCARGRQSLLSSSHTPLEFDLNCSIATPTLLS